MYKIRHTYDYERIGMQHDEGREAPMANNMASSGPTSVDVARRAEVSQSAVSLVFGGKAAGRVGKRTQEAILEAARELGYRPNSAARTLRSGRSRLVALVVPDVSNPYFAAVLQGAEQAARASGYSVMLAQVRDEQDWQPTVLDPLTSRAVDGFLFCTLLPPTMGEQATLQGKAVLVDARSRALPSLQLDIEAGMHAVMTHLLGLGHTKIAHLAASVDAETFHARHRAYLDALQRAGCQETPAYQAQAPFSIPDACQAARGLLTRADPPSAIICDSDVLAVGVYKAARDLQRSIPQDVSVASFDDSLIAGILDPELTTVAIPARALGEQAFLLLLRVLYGEQVSAPITVPLELVIRASTAGASVKS
jgi:LacI family repressor for deo operon, udp, cdd, tsx, nupC, and nupG